MIGGFLGAGKTTAVAQLAKHLSDGGLRVGLITNDQGRGLVDTRMLRSKGFVTEEIPGGCFCCRFNSLLDAARRLTAQTRPDVFIAEPVGSCTDLVATVTYPLRRIYGAEFSIAPLSVLVDPIRAQRVFGLTDGGNFSGKVVYIYKKQLEEADIIVVSKSDLVAEPALAALMERLRAEFPQAEVLAAAPRHGTGLMDWFDRLQSKVQAGRKPMEVDYDIYADGEALLGWLNCTIAMTSAGEFDANAAIQSLAADLRGRLEASAAEVAHLKMTFSPDEQLAGEIATINLVRNDWVPELSMTLEDAVSGGQLIVNLRAEADPEILSQLVRDAVAQLAEQTGIRAAVEHEEHFRPGRPTPTHRETVAVD